MKLHSFFFFILCLLAPLLSKAQSKTTEALQKKYSDALAFFFYNNTLRMLNQTEDKSFDELIRNIEKMKLLMIKKTEDAFTGNYKKLVSDYKAEAFEEIMTSRMEGKNFDIFIKEKNKKTQAMLVLVNDDKNLYVLDIVGSIALNKVGELYKTIDNSSDIGKRIKAFTDNDDSDKGKEKLRKIN